MLRTSVRGMPGSVVSMVSMRELSAIGRVNAGHPHPESNLSFEENNGSPLAAST